MQKEADDDSLDGVVLSGSCYDDGFAANEHGSGGIALLTQFSAQICRDMDAPSVAKYAEMCGRLTLLGLALPVFLTLTQMAVDVLR